MSRWATLQGNPPRIIAHRGASGDYPEHVLPGYQHALDLGADVIEPDLVPSRDGVLFCRHDLGLARSTDIATRSPLADRRQAGDWPCNALDAVEIDSLRAIQPFAGRSREHDGRYPPPRFSAMVEWAGKEADRRGRPLVLYPEIKHPAELRAAGVDPLPLFAAAVATLPPGVVVWLQCFDVYALAELRQLTGLPCALLIDSRGDPWQALAEHGDWLSALALSKRWLQHPAGGPALIEAIHRRGLWLDLYTFRDDQPGLGFERCEDELQWAMQLGADGLFCDYPQTALAVRRAVEDQGAAL